MGKCWVLGIDWSMAMQQGPIYWRYRFHINKALISGNIPANYGQKYGTFTYFHQLDPEIPIELVKSSYF